MVLDDAATPEEGSLLAVELAVWFPLDSFERLTSTPTPKVAVGDVMTTTDVDVDGMPCLTVVMVVSLRLALAAEVAEVVLSQTPVGVGRVMVLPLCAETAVCRRTADDDGDARSGRVALIFVTGTVTRAVNVDVTVVEVWFFPLPTVEVSVSEQLVVVVVAVLFWTTGVTMTKEEEDDM